MLGMGGGASQTLSLTVCSLWLNLCLRLIQIMAIPLVLQLRDHKIQVCLVGLFLLFLLLAYDFC